MLPARLDNLLLLTEAKLRFSKFIPVLRRVCCAGWLENGEVTGEYNRAQGSGSQVWT